MSNDCITYHIDQDDRIIYLSDEWQPFADKNKASHLTSEVILNNRFNDFVTDTKSKHIYTMLIDRSRNHQEELKFPFRCDAPDRRRFMSMTLTPLDDGVIVFKSCIVKEVTRDPVSLLDVSTERSDEMILICSWCKKIKAEDDDWLEVESAIEKMSLFNKEILPELSHGMCEVCFDKLSKDI